MPKLTKIELLRYVKKAFYIWSGLCLIIIGIAGLILPIIPGIIPIAFGITLLAKGSKKFRNHEYTKKIYSQANVVREEIKNRKKVAGKIISIF